MTARDLLSLGSGVILRPLQSNPFSPATAGYKVSKSPISIQSFQATTKNQGSDASGGHSEQQIPKILLDTQ